MQVKQLILLVSSILFLQSCTTTKNSTKESDKQTDYQALVAGKWILGSINDAPINRSIVLPTLEIDSKQMKVSGSGGCNSYSGTIEKLLPAVIQFGPILNTTKACINKNIESDYLAALNESKTYKIEGANLIFYNKKGKEILSYLKQEKKEANQRLHDIWITKRIDGNPVDRKTALPNLEINLTENKVFGSDGCNNYTGSIKEVSDSKLLLGILASTKKMCPEMELTQKFNTAITKVVAYKLEGLNLILLDKNGQEVLAFLKGD